MYYDWESEWQDVWMDCAGVPPLEFSALRSVPPSLQSLWPALGIDAAVHVAALAWSLMQRCEVRCDFSSYYILRDLLCSMKGCEWEKEQTGDGSNQVETERVA
eukprot:1187545-Prorocentrum_minimum.AAC.6